MIYVFLANGFEETEAVAPIDIMRRCRLDVITVGIGGSTIESSHGIKMLTDITDKEIKLDEKLEAIVLPGGKVGVENLEASEIVQKAIDYCVENDIYIGAICAAPSILGHKGLLKGRKAISYPSFEQELDGAELVREPAVRDGKIITSRGAGASIDFGLKLAEVLVSPEKSKEIGDAIVWLR